MTYWKVLWPIIRKRWIDKLQPIVNHPSTWKMPLRLKEAILQDSQRQETQRDLEGQMINIEIKGRSLTKGEQEDTHC